MWSILFVYLYVFEVSNVSALRLRDIIGDKHDKNANGRRRKPLNKYFHQGGVKLKTKRVKVPLADYLTSFRMQDFQDRLADYVQRTVIFDNLTHRQATYHFMSGFLTQLDKEFVIESKLEEPCADHFLLPRLQTKHDDTVIVLQYSGASDSVALEDQVNRGLDDMLAQNYRHQILQYFPGGKKESKRIQKVLLVSLGIAKETVLVKHRKYKLESRTDRFSQAVLSYLSQHDMRSLQRILDEYIISSRVRIESEKDLKNLVEGILDQHEDYYPKSKNPRESIYIPVNRQKKRKNIAYLIRYKVLQKGYEGINRNDELEDELDDCYLQNTGYFEQFSTVDTVRTILLTHKT